MATSDTNTTAAKPKRRAAPARKPRAAASRTTPTRTDRGRQLAERAVLIPVGVALEARDRVAGTVGGLVPTLARKDLNANVEILTTRVERVVKDGVDAGMKLVNGVQDRLSKVV
jgi:hypothetical protein